MTRATPNALDPQVLSAGADGDAIIPSRDVRVKDQDVARELDVDSIRVRAVAVGLHSHPLDANVPAPVYGDVEHLAVHGHQVFYPDVVRVGEAQCLRIRTASENKFNSKMISKCTLSIIFTGTAQESYPYSSAIDEGSKSNSEKYSRCLSICLWNFSFLLIFPNRYL